MGSYSIVWRDRARKELKRLPKPEIARIITAINSLSDNPHPQGGKKLAGADSIYRIRQGNYRIIYSIENQQLIIDVIRIGHRKEVYRYL